MSKQKSKVNKYAKTISGIKDAILLDVLEAYFLYLTEKYVDKMLKIKYIAKNRI